MFLDRYFPRRYFPLRYYPPIGDVVIPVDPSYRVELLTGVYDLAINGAALYSIEQNVT